LVEGDALARLRAEIAAIVGPTLRRLGWEGRFDDHRTRQLRGLLINVMGTNAKDRDTIARAREVYANPAASDADVQSAVIAVGAGDGTSDAFDEFLERAAATSSPQEQLRYLYALGDFPAEVLALRAAELTLTDEIRAQTGPFVVQRALRNRDHGAA